jgi:hypothetical protein
MDALERHLDRVDQSTKRQATKPETRRRLTRRKRRT